jgi:SAM-dependent methyltransferase
MQTLGDVDAVSPDYVDLKDEAMDDTHLFIQTRHKHPAFAQWQSLVLSHRPAAPEDRALRLLDIGCGVGGFLDFAKETGAEVYGFDASPVQVRHCQLRHPSVRLSYSIDDYFRQLGQRPALDAITMWDVFEHIREPLNFLAGVRQACAPETLMFVSVPSGAINPAKIAIGKMTGRQPGLIPWEHVFYYTKRSLPAMFDRAGFDVLDVGSVATYQRPPSPHEFVRRAAHRLLAPTRYAFQIYALVRVRG